MISIRRLVPTRTGDGRRRGGLVTTVTIVVSLVAMVGTLLGSGAPRNPLSGFDASSWLWSSPKGELARVNGATGRVDTRVRITDGQGRAMQVAQSDRFVILRDVATGRVSVLDLATLQVAATTETAPGRGITVVVRDTYAFIVDGVQGLVRQLDPATLSPVGQPMRFPPGLIGGIFDDQNRLWLLVPSEGTLVSIQPGVGVGVEPRVTRSVGVAEPAHEISLTILDGGGVAVLDNTAATMTVLDGLVVPLALSAPGAVAPRTTGSRVPVTVAETRGLMVVSGATVARYSVPGAGSQLGPCVAWSGRFYCPDDADGTVYVLDEVGRPTAPIRVSDPGGQLELEVREGRLFINSPGSANARVVDDRHKVSIVDKYTNNIPGGDPPPTQPAQPPSTPTVSTPGAPGRVTAVAGNAQARVSWTPAAANGAPILRYVIDGGGRPVEVGANQRSLTVTGLTNGTEYRFTVHAVNGRGAGPKRAANPVVPTGEVPDAPTAAAAEARPDGTVSVTWPAANGQGRKIVRYEVTAVTRGAPAPAGETGGTTLVIPAGHLTYGTQYAFTVMAVNDRGASSEPSPISNTVTPYNKPGPPANVRAVTVNKRGTIDVSWQPAAENGRAISHYLVVAGNQRQEVSGTSVTLSGFDNGATVQISVRAVNEAGEGTAVLRTARTIDVPKLSVTGSATGLNSITVNFTVADGGSPPTCTLSITGGGQASGKCTTLTAGGVWPGREYTWKLTVTNAAGGDTASGTATTRALTGTVICADASYCGPGAPNGGIWVYTTATQTGTTVGDVFTPSEYKAVCKVADSRGTTINATPWGGKRSNMWVRIVYPAGKENYIPFAWFRLAEGDNLALLPSC